MNINANKFIKGTPEYDNRMKIADVQPLPEEPVKKRKYTRKAQTEEPQQQSTAVVPVQAQTSMSYIQENIPYAGAYAETTRQLDESINQLNALGAEIVTELSVVKNNKTLRNKYNIINEMTQTATSILSTKLTAIREKNNVINNINKLELDRLKQIKTTASEEDDNARIANLYDAFINTPIGTGRSALAPPVQDMMLFNQSGMNSMPVMSIGNDQAAWESSLDPAQNRMLLEARGTIETVVMYDAATGNRWFEVLDKASGQPVPNVEKPDSTYIYDLDLNVRANIARDSNRNATYRLITIGNDMSMSEY